MKRVLLLYATLLSLCATQIASPKTARSYVQYALITADTPLLTVSGEPICTLPATYFVVLAQKDAQSCFVSFQDIEGYVSTSALEFVDYEPVTKFPYRTARVSNDGLPVNLRTQPSAKSGSLVAQVPEGAVLTLYGPREGDELYAGAGTVWQYVCYASASGSVFGYVYAPLLVSSALSPNVIEKMPQPNASVGQSTSDPHFSELTKIAFIAALCVPALIITLYMFYRPESKRTPRHARRRE